MKIASVIPAYNGEMVIDGCIESLLTQNCEIDRLYVLDQCSADKTASVARHNPSSKVICISLAENIGPTGGFASGISIALNEGCDWVWLMDQDATAYPDSLEKLLRCGESDESIVAVAPAKVDEVGLLWTGENVAGGVGPNLERFAGQAFDIESTMWSGLLIRASAIREVGLPLVQLFGWWCDGEYCHRLRKIGRVVLEPSSRIMHHRTGAVHLDWNGYWKHYYYQRNSMYLYLNGHLPSPGVAHILYGVMKQVAYITLRQDHKIERLRILLTAAVHAFVGRMGRGPAWLH